MTGVGIDTVPRFHGDEAFSKSMQSDMSHMFSLRAHHAPQSDQKQDTEGRVECHLDGKCAL